MALTVLLKDPRRSTPITMKTRGVHLDETLEQVIYSNVRTALGRFSKRIRSVLVWVEDANGPRDGSGILCRMLVGLARGGRLTASAEAANEYAAVAACASRARTLLDRHIKRLRRTRRPPRIRRHQRCYRLQCSSLSCAAVCTKLRPARKDMNMNVLELNDKKVTLGSSVAVRDLHTGEVDLYTIVAPGHADIATCRISITTPVAHAIYGRRAGDEVEVIAPGGTIRLRIESVRPQSADDYG